MSAETWLPSIGGRPRAPAGNRVRPLADPATGETFAEVALCGAVEAAEAIEAARAAFAAPAWRDRPGAERARLLFELARLLRRDREELALLESRNAGKRLASARAEVAQAADCFEYYAGAIGKVGGQTWPLRATGVNLSFREPLGVCVAIVPFNYPLLIASWKVAPALAMGNTVVLKPASATPLTALRLAALAAEAGLPPGTLNVIPGSGAEAGEALLGHPVPRKISFTGSTEVGRHVMRRAAEHLQRLTLELGGKSAALVFADAPLEKALPAVLRGILANAGQDCCARSRLLVERPILRRFTEKVVAAMQAVRVGPPLDPDTEVGPLISREHRDRVRSYVDAGIAEGALLACGGDVLAGRGAYLRPAVFEQVHPEMRIAREEIFGPVLCVIPFDTEEEAIELANRGDYGLSGSIWTRDLGRALRVARAVRAGVLALNSGSSIHLEAPFGGVGASGFGKELGLAALDGYSEIKSIYIDTERDSPLPGPT